MGSTLLAEVQYKANGAFTRTLMFLHDEKGAIVGIGVKNAGDARFTHYYYAKNLQGDVVAIYRSDYTEAKGYYPTLVASYEYDPWGKVTSVKGSSGAILSLEAYPNHIAHVNPIRYRGYYYDNETGFYYLQSRYYDPAISRFINADSYGSTGQGFLGTNMFAYCNNNPVNYTDPTGHRPIWEKRYGSMVMYTDTGAGGQFSSANEAAQNVGKTMAIMTQSDNLERACAIYKDETNGYYFGEIVTGEHDYVPVGLIWPNEGPYPVAMIHSHPNCTGHVPNDFSYYDELGYPTGDWSVVLNYGIPLYLVAPDGSLLRLTVDPVYIVPEPCVAIISQDLPVDDSIFDCR